MEQQANLIRDGLAELHDPTSAAPPSGQPASTVDAGAPLRNPTEEELGCAVAANLFALFRAMRHLPGAELEETPALARHCAFPVNPMFNGAWQSRLAAHDADAAIAETVAWFKACSAPFAFWWLDPRATPWGYGRAAARARLRPLGRERARHGRRSGRTTL